MIVNSWYFYALQLVTNLRCLLITLSVLFIVAGIILFIENDISSTTYKVKSKMVIGVCCLALAMLIPSRETLLLMKAAEFVTYDNVQNAADALKSAIDYATTLF